MRERERAREGEVERDRERMSYLRAGDQHQSNPWCLMDGQELLEVTLLRVGRKDGSLGDWWPCSSQDRSGGLPAALPSLDFLPVKEGILPHRRGCEQLQPPTEQAASTELG